MLSDLLLNFNWLCESRKAVVSLAGLREPYELNSVEVPVIN